MQSKNATKKSDAMRAVLKTARDHSRKIALVLALVGTAVIGSSAATAATMEVAPPPEPPSQQGLASQSISITDLELIPPPPPPPPPVQTQVVQLAELYIGTPYVYAGASPSGFDCSGFTMYVYAQFGVTLEHGAWSQLSEGTVIPEDAALPGDLVWMPGHVGIWMGHGMMLDSPDYGRTVDIRPIYTSNYTIFRVVS